MDEIKRLYVGVINSVEKTIFDLTNGAVLKTIMFYNDAETEETITLNIDGSIFKFKIASKQTFVLDKSIVCNILKASTTGEVNIHISGLQLGVA